MNSYKWTQMLSVIKDAVAKLNLLGKHREMTLVYTCFDWNLDWSQISMVTLLVFTQKREIKKLSFPGNISISWVDGKSHSAIFLKEAGAPQSWVSSAQQPCLMLTLDRPSLSLDSSSGGVSAPTLFMSTVWFYNPEDFSLR